MKKMLKNTVKIAGVLIGLHDRIFGDISSGLYGDISGLYGNISGLSGDVDDCEISDEDRDDGIDISELIGE